MEYILDNGIPFQIHGTAGKNISGNHGTMSGYIRRLSCSGTGGGPKRNSNLCTKGKTANGAKFHSVISSGRQSPCIVAPILQRLGELMLLNMLLCRKIISRKIQPLVSKLSTSAFRPEYASLVGTRKYII